MGKYNNQQSQSVQPKAPLEQLEVKGLAQEHLSSANKKGNALLCQFPHQDLTLTDNNWNTLSMSNN